MTLLLNRFAYLPDATLGTLLIPNGCTLYTIERPWKENKAFISCIPTGTYDLEWDSTGRVRDVPRLRNTHPRTQINIHVANYAHELHGCIAPGMDWDIDGKEAMVTNSRNAMELLLEYLLTTYDQTLDPTDGDSLNCSIVIENFVNAPGS